MNKTKQLEKEIKSKAEEIDYLLKFKKEASKKLQESGLQFFHYQNIIKSYQKIIDSLTFGAIETETEVVRWEKSTAHSLGKDYKFTFKQ